MSWDIRVRVPSDDFAGARLEDEALDGAVEIVTEARDKLVERVKQILSRSGDGPASPDAPPHEHTGALAESIVGEAVVVKKDRVWARVVATDPGAARLEFGDVDKRGIRTFPHPFLRVAFEEMESKIRELLRGWAETVRK